jgi:hypothetical protein
MGAQAHVGLGIGNVFQLATSSDPGASQLSISSIPYFVQS